MPQLGKKIEKLGTLLETVKGLVFTKVRMQEILGLKFLHQLAGSLQVMVLVE